MHHSDWLKYSNFTCVVSWHL